MRPRNAIDRGGEGAVLMALAFCLALTGCGRASSGSDPDRPRADLDDYLVAPVGVEPDALPDPRSEGAHLAAEFCGQCHGVPAPSSHSAADWRPILRNMFLRSERMSRMGMMGGMMMSGGMMGRRPVVMPSADEERDLVAYYQEHALRALPEGATPAPGPGEELFARQCARCHALPDPGAYTARQWPAVVARMREVAARMKVREITDQQAREIIAYLARASSGRAAQGP